MKQIQNLLFATLLLFFCSAPLSAQFRYGIKAGLNLATIAPHSDLENFYEEDYFEAKFTPQMLPGFHVALLGEYGFNKNIGIGLALELSAKGYKYENSFTEVGSTYSYSERINPMYLQIPLTFNFRSNGFFAAVGPYFGLGISGQYTVELDEDGDMARSNGDLTFSNNFNEDSETLVENIGPFDAGIGLELGYEYKKLRFSAAYSLGLMNIYSKDLVTLAREEGDINNFKATHRVIGVSVAYILNPKAEE